MKIFIFCLGFIFIGNQCAGQIKLTLKDAIDSALTRNPIVKQSELSRDLNQEDLKQAQHNRLPSINASPQFSSNWGRSLDLSTYNYITQRVSLISGSIGVQLNLYQGGAIRNQILQNKYILEAGESNVSKVRSDLILEVLTAFFQVLTDQDLLKVSIQQVNLAKLNLEIAQKGFNAGNKSIADLSQAQSQQALSNLDKTIIQSRLNISMENLKELISLQDTDIFIVEPNSQIFTGSSGIRDSSKILSQALEHNPNLKMLSYQARAALQGIRVAKSALLPSLTLFSSVGSNYSDARSLITGTQQVGFDTIGRVSGTNQPVLSPLSRTVSKDYSFIRQFTDNFYQSVGLTLQIPLFNRFNNKANVRKATLSYQIAETAINIKKNNLVRVIKQAIGDIQISLDRLVAANSVYQANKEVFKVSKKRYEAGLVNSLEYNTAIINFNKAEFDQIQAKYSLLFRYKVMDFYTGNPLQL